MRTPIALLVALAAACGGGEGRQASPVQTQAVKQLLASLASDAAVKGNPIGFANLALGAGLLASLPPMKAAAPADPCAVQNGDTLVINCPGVVGTVRTAGAQSDIDLTITSGLGNGITSLKLHGYLIQGEYSTGHLYYEWQAAAGAGSMTVDWEVFSAGPSSHGWVTFTWHGAVPWNQGHSLLRVVFDGDLFTITYA